MEVVKSLDLQKTQDLIGSTTSHNSTCPRCGEELRYQYLDFLGERIVFRCKCEMEKEKERVLAEARQREWEHIARLFDASKLGRRFRRCTLESFLPRPGTERALSAVRGFLSSPHHLIRNGDDKIPLTKPFGNENP